MPPITPFFPPISPYILPTQPFEQLIAQYGINFKWLKSHSCACVMDSTNPGKVAGSPDPACITCQGRGLFWDPPLAVPFRGLLTFMHMAPTPDEPGLSVDERYGILQRGDPTITIPFTADVNNTIWTQSSVFDAFVEIDALSRYNATLKVGEITAVPYQQGLSIAASGAVTVYNPQTFQTVPASYTVSGATVLLASGFAKGTAYVVEFQANPVWVAFRKAGGYPHMRPFGGGVVNTPKRFRLMPLDLWTRERSANGIGPQALGAP